MGSNWKNIKECGVVDPAFLSYLNFDQGAAKAIGVKIHRFRCQQSFSVTGNTLLLNKYHRVRWKTRSAECGVRSVENAECGKCGV